MLAVQVAGEVEDERLHPPYLPRERRVGAHRDRGGQRQPRPRGCGAAGRRRRRRPGPRPGRRLEVGGRVAELRPRWSPRTTTPSTRCARPSARARGARRRPRRRCGCRWRTTFVASCPAAARPQARSRTAARARPAPRRRRPPVRRSGSSPPRRPPGVQRVDQHVVDELRGRAGELGGERQHADASTPSSSTASALWAGWSAARGACRGARPRWGAGRR